jgi:hypothetical protein
MDAAGDTAALDGVWTLLGGGKPPRLALQARGGVDHIPDGGEVEHHQLAEIALAVRGLFARRGRTPYLRSSTPSVVCRDGPRQGRSERDPERVGHKRPRRLTGHLAHEDDEGKDRRE